MIVYPTLSENVDQMHPANPETAEISQSKDASKDAKDNFLDQMLSESTLMNHCQKKQPLQPPLQTVELLIELPLPQLDKPLLKL